MSESESKNFSFKYKEDFYLKLDNYFADKPSEKPLSKKEVEATIAEVMIAKNKLGKKTKRECNLLNKYDVRTVHGHSYLIQKNSDPDITPIIVPYEEVFDEVFNHHVKKTGHGERCTSECPFANEYLFVDSPKALSSDKNQLGINGIIEDLQKMWCKS